MQHDFRLVLFPQLIERAINLAIAQLGIAGDFRQRLADFGRVDIDAADDLDPGLFRGEIDGGNSDRAEPELCDFDRFHGSPKSPPTHWMGRAVYAPQSRVPYPVSAGSGVAQAASFYRTTYGS